MTTARDVMTRNAKFCPSDATAASAARMMAEENIGSIPVCSPDGGLIGMITDRDLTLRVVAKNRKPDEVLLLELVSGEQVFTIGVDDSVDDALKIMKDHAIRRLPVIDGMKLVGMVSQADIAEELSAEVTGDVVAAISEAASNN